MASVVASRGGSRKADSGIYRHRHTNTLKRQTKHVAGLDITKVTLAKSSRVKLRLNILISILEDKPGILPPMKGLLVIFKVYVICLVWLFQHVPSEREDCWQLDFTLLSCYH